MIYLFGSTGMLGCYVKNILNKYYNTISINRKEFDILNDEWNKLYEILDHLQETDIIINCAGIIPQKTSATNYRSYIKINSLFPHKLQNICENKKCKLIHITTDCVFNGKKNDSYDENDIHTEKNIYGISKSLGEPENATIIRTSIIGEEINGKKSLLEWIKSKKNETINGYSNHLWNGITCLQLALIIKKIIDKKLFWKGIKHIYSPNIVSKYDLCVYINEIYNLNITINKFSTETINKTLKSIYKPLFEIENIKNQIETQYLFTLH